MNVLLLLDWLLSDIAREWRSLCPQGTVAIPCLVIAPPTLHSPSLYLVFIPYFV